MKIQFEWKRMSESKPKPGKYIALRYYHGKTLLWYLCYIVDIRDIEFSNGGGQIYTFVGHNIKPHTLSKQGEKWLTIKCAPTISKEYGHKQAQFVYWDYFESEWNDPIIEDDEILSIEDIL